MSPAWPSPATSRVRMSFTVGSSAGRGRVGQQSHLTRVLDRTRELALLLGGHAGDPARADLAAVGHELAQHVGVLVVDVLDLRREQRVVLLLGLANRWLGHVDLFLEVNAGCKAPGAGRWRVSS